MSETPFNGAPEAAFDHDGDGKAGGGKPKRVPVVDLGSGLVETMTAAKARDAAAAGTHRLATRQDLRIHGRDDLLSLIKDA